MAYYTHSAMDPMGTVRRSIAALLTKSLEVKTVNRYVYCLVLIFVIGLTVRQGASADTTPNINLNFPESDAMSVTDILKVVAMETGAVILPDNSVIGAVGAIHTTQTSVPDVLDFLKGYEPGLTWQVFYYPASSNQEPSGEDVYQAIQLFNNFRLDGLVLPPQGENKIMYSYKKQQYTTPEQEKAAEQGFQAYYLVSDPGNRAAMIKQVKASTTAPPPTCRTRLPR